MRGKGVKASRSRPSAPPGAGYRDEHDSLGRVQVPADALWGAQTQRAVENFAISGLCLPAAFIAALGRIKAVAAETNAELGLLDGPRARAIASAARELVAGRHGNQFPVDVFQTGSGTSSNMNANEVIAALASRASGREIHPNDHVNLGQSSNDCIPTAIHVAAAIEVHERLLPALTHLGAAITLRGRELKSVVKTGRTHLMDAMPLRLDQEMSGWAQQVRNGCDRLRATLPRVLRLAQGGTAVGTGINAHPRFARVFARRMARDTGLAFRPSPNLFESLSSQDAACELSGQLRVIACSLMKISNDLRWMNSGPLAGLGEIELAALQPGSSIMPGKVNPVIPEAVCMAAAKVIGNDASIAIAAQSGNFQLNVMLPLVAHALLESITLLANAARSLADQAVTGLVVREDRVAEALQRNPILVTALNPVIGYEKGAQIAKRAYREQRPVLDVAQEVTGLKPAQLKRLLDPGRLTRGGIQGKDGSG